MPDGEITALLHRISNGERSAEGPLMEHVYRELKRIAAVYLRGERPGHTLQPTALVNEAYVRLMGDQAPNWSGRAHFFATAAQVMRRILVDHARARNAVRRGGGAAPVSLDEALELSTDDYVLVLQIDGALNKLAELDKRLARMVELRFFAGMSEQEIAQIMEVSVRTVKRDWAVARAWLHSELEG